ncbi:hypothetical protein EUTSA_v10009584mg [Eutrema salsugineum]|uniref:Uncharacterized protein n=1 Tax=Eutrema salsugineum TaxID=72664 RepID=V4KQ33_EUTSA|nr:hypothetical protein EUTSA_v10009584mg [Eutrema salsugineum]
MTIKAAKSSQSERDLQHRTSPLHLHVVPVAEKLLHMASEFATPEIAPSNLDLMRWLSTPVAPSSLMLRRLTTQTLIFLIWRERNNRLHNSVSTPHPVIFKQIDRLAEKAIDLVIEMDKEQADTCIVSSYLQYVVIELLLPPLPLS